ncbi:non-ribosomal peptide synthetase, partial [Mesobacillus foraminis]
MKDNKFEDIYSLSPMQEGMLFHSLLSDSDAYFEQMAITLKGSLDLQAFEQCFNLMIKRHSIFRSVFLHEGVSKPKQVVLKERSIKVGFEDLSSKPSGVQNEVISTYKAQDKIKGFNLSKDLLMRLAVFRTGKEDYKVIWSFHHILMDGWSLGIVLNELFELYRKIRNRDDLSLGKPAEFSSYISWLRRQDQQEAQQFWDDYLRNYEQTANLPSRNTSPVLSGYERKEMVFKVGPDLTEKLNGLAKECKVTLNVIIQAVWGLILQKYNDTTDVVFGTIVSGRTSEIPNVEKMVGLFINAVPVRVKTYGGQCFLELVKQLQEQALRSEPFGYLSLADIQAGKETGNQLINHMVVFENYPLDESVQSGDDIDKFGISLTEVDAFDQTNYDFNLLIGPGQDLIIKMVFNERRYTAETIHDVFSHLKMVINTIVHSPGILVDEIDMMSAEEKSKLMGISSSLETTYPMASTLTSLFEEQVQKEPSRTAVVHGERKISYSQLNGMANQVARSLRRQGVQREQVVGILTERSTEMIVSMLGVLKAGAAYLPIDPEYPEERIFYMLEDSGAKSLIVQHPEDVPDGFNGQVISLWEREWEKEDPSDLEGGTRPEDLAYIIYTSGSTGKPKGVMVEHRNVVRLLFNDRNFFDFSGEDVWTMFHSYCFDFSVWEMYGALLYGGRLVLVPTFVARDPEAFAQLLLKEGVTILNQTPTAFYQLSRQMEKLKPDGMPVRKVIFGGEKLLPLQLKNWKLAYPATQLINMYGITETTVHVTYKEITVKDIEANISNIGKPIPTLQVYVLDGRRNLLPVGVSGEMYVAGEGVARGYLNRPELTEERFVENPFNPGERMYRTGDLARWLEDGNLEYLGRIDDQVKIRGHRIEVGEIEARLLSFPHIKEVCVIARRDSQGHLYLCAYLVARHVSSQQSIRDHLKEMLPEYMIPAHYVFLDRFPLTSNGKIDRSRLPEPQKGSLASYQAPVNSTERDLADIWSQILEIKQVGRRDHFFELGGHSLMATQLAAAIHKKFETRISIQKIFENPLLMDMAHYISGSGKEAFTIIEQAAKKEFYPVTTAQRRMYVVQQIEGDTKTTHYNMPLILELEGEIDTVCLIQSLSTLVDRHEPLRTTFHLKNERLTQRIETHHSFETELKDVTEEELPKLIDEFVQPFNLGTHLPFRALLAKVEKTRYILLLDFHHIVSDGISVNILLQELFQLYQGRELPSLTIQYKDYAQWQQTKQYKERLNTGEGYWLDQFKGEVPVLELPSDFPRPPERSFSGETLEFELDSRLFRKLKNHSAAEGSTLYMILLAAYNILLSKYAGQEDIVVGMPVAGREHSDLEDIVGMFINTLPIRNEPKGHLTIGEFIGNVRARVLQAFEHAEYPLEDLIEKLEVPRNLSHQPLFNTIMIMQNMKIDEILVPGLTVKPHPWRWKNAKYDLTWTVIEGDSLKVLIEYSTSLFKKETVERMYRHLTHLLSQMVEEPAKLISEVQLATPSEVGKILNAFNSPHSEFPREKTIHEIFAGQAKNAADNIAVIYEKGTMSYGELHRKSNQVARLLRKQGAGRGQIIGLLADRSSEMIVSILGVLKAGAAYLPIDPDYPEQRISYMLDDSGAESLIVQHPEDVPDGFNGKVLALWEREWEKEDPSDLEGEACPGDLAYIIYTSGSTGKPKGVMVEHRNVVRLLFNDRNLFDFSGEDVWTMFHSYCFDFSVWEMYGALLYGGRLVLVPTFVARDPEAFARLLLREGVTILNQTPTAFYQLSRQMEKLKPDGMPVRKVIFGGEKLSPLQLKNWKLDYPATQLINMYGITETTVHVTYKEITEKDIEANISNIGKPIPTLQVYVLDGRRNLLPVGVSGEMYVAGEGVARGYLNRPELTEERFVENPFNPGERMYRTGDLARWLGDGNLEYLGRIDDQVKIRGHRIEIGEIENRLISHGNVKDAVVISVKEQDYSYLCAYVVPSGHLKVSSVRNHMRKILPDYMIPSYFVEVDTFPLTPNGKIDKKALPKPSSSRPASEGYTAPLSDREKLLASVWEEV